jgi:excinuclease ABC subunit B
MKPIDVEPSRWPITLERGVDPQPLRKKIADITDLIARESEDTEELLSHEKGGAKKVGASAGIYDKSSLSCRARI